MKLTNLRSCTTVMESPVSNAPRPPAPAGQCSTALPSKCPPHCTAVTPGTISTEPAQLAHPVHGRLVGQADAVPQHVPAGRPDQQGPLADPQPRLDADPGQAVLDVPDLRAESFLAELLLDGPPLARPPDVLALVLADGATLRRPVGRSVLHRAGSARERLHGGSNYATWPGSPWWGTWSGCTSPGWRPSPFPARSSTPTSGGRNRPAAGASRRCRW